METRGVDGIVRSTSLEIRLPVEVPVKLFIFMALWTAYVNGHLIPSFTNTHNLLFVSTDPTCR